MRGSKRVFGVCALVACMSLTACADYAGEGDEFKVVGVVTDSGKESLKLRITEIREADGRAEGWFAVDKEHRLHDNCECHGFWNGKKQYGQVIDSEGNVIRPDQVQEGMCAYAEGRIRADNEGKTHEYRPVFENVEISACR